MPASSATFRALATVGGVCGLLVGTAAVEGPANAATAAATTSAPASVAPPASAGMKVTNTAIVPVSASKSVASAKTVSAEGLATPAGTEMLAYTKRAVVPGFSLYGVTWDHRTNEADITVSIRTLDEDVWSEWTELETDHDGGPATTSEDTAFRDGTEPTWVGDASGIEVAVFGTGKAPSGLKVSTIDPGADPTSGAVSEATVGSAAVAKAGTIQTTPRIVTRRGWGADESLGDTCFAPRFGRTFKAVIIHHTAGSNTYTKAESKALVRGIYAYHTQSRGWCDIGYNFLVDKFGTIYEGRDGGIRRPVRGAHAGDYNVNTTGISLMGNFETARPTSLMKAAVVRLTAWRLGTAYHGAYGKPFLFDGRFNRISGHRDVMSTACPGRYVYDWLPKLRARVETRIGAHVSPIERYWRSTPARSRKLGPVAIGEQADARGQFTTFAGGGVYRSKAGLKVIADGPLLTRYRALGQTSGYLGYPRSRSALAGAHGRQILFQGGRIYWSKAAGAHDLSNGAILRAYRARSGASGRLGFPTTSITIGKYVNRARFQHGSIGFDRATKKITVTYR